MGKMCDLTDFDHDIAGSLDHLSKPNTPKLLGGAVTISSKDASVALK